MNPTKIADVIDLAVENLEQCPWGQGNGRVAEYKICAQDAIWMAAAGQRTLEEFWGQRATQALGSEGLRRANQVADEVTRVVSMRLDPVYHDRLFAWNDNPRRTKDQVIDLLKETAKDLRNSASPT